MIAEELHMAERGNLIAGPASTKRGAPVWLGVGAAAGLAALGLLVGSNPDTLISRGYERALGGAETAWRSDQSPNILLSKVADRPQAVAKPVAVGDQISISGKAGGTSRIEVTKLEQVDGHGFGADGTHFQVVTGVLVDAGAPAQAARTVRLILAIDPPVANTLSARAADKVL
jgi:hypothetical protein